jgi:hypothetical protein
MAQITWRNVEAPDFRGATAGYETFSRLLGGATDDLSKSLTVFDKAQNRGVDQQVLMDALRFQDPASLRAALQSGSLTAGVDPRRVSLDTLTALGTRATTLNEQDKGQIDNNKSAYTFGRTVEQNSALDASRPLQTQLAVAANSSDVATQQRLLSDPTNQAALSRLTPEQIWGTVGNVQAGDSGNSAVTNARLGATQAVRNDGASQEATKHINAILRESGTDPNGQLASFESRANNMTPAAQALVRQALPQMYTGTGGGIAGGAASPVGSALATAAGGTAPGAATAGGTGSFAIPAGAAGFGTTKGSAYDMTVGGVATPKPLTQMTLSEVKEFGKKTLIPGNAGKYGNPEGVGSSAAGAYQVTGQTLDQYAPKVLGKDWESLPYSPENQEKIAKAIFEDRKGGNLKTTWTSLPNGTAGAYKDMSWDQFKQVVAPGEVGGTPGTGTAASPAAAALAADANPATTRANTTQVNNVNAAASMLSTQAAKMQSNVRGVGLDYAKALKEGDKTAGQVAEELRTGPDFKGTSAQFLKTQIERVMTESNVSASVAGAALRRNTMGSDKDFWSPKQLIRQLTPGSTPNLGNGTRLNDAGLAKTIADLKSGRPLEQAVINEQLDAKTKQVDDARTAANTLLQTLQATQAKAQVQPGLNSFVVPGLQRQYAQANAALEAALQDQRQTMEYNAEWEKKNTPVASSAGKSKVGEVVKIVAPKVAAPVEEEAPRSEIDQKIMAAQKKASSLSMGSMERSRVLNEIRDLQMQRAAAL